VGIFDRFKRTTTINTITWGDTSDAYYGAWQLNRDEYERIMGLSPSQMWATQPYLRTVVTFMARNIAQLSLQTFQRISDTDRQRVHDGVAEILKRPNLATTGYELVYGVVADLALYDVAYWLLSEDPDNAITRLPFQWVWPKGGDAYQPDHYEVRMNDRGESVKIPADQILVFHGWNPSNLRTGSSAIQALREILAEQVQAARYRESVWARGGKVGAVLTRPPEAPDWSDEARRQFKADWDSRYTGSGPGVGGTPLLEDGMSLARVDFSAHEMEWVEGSRLALNTVASVYHINPTMIGLLDNANYSNVREFRRMLYGDTLGPVIAQLEDRLNTFYVPLIDDRPGIYVEFNIDEKLQGSFEEQTSAIQAAVGAPWMTRDEARALRNLPAIDGADELVTPLNVLVGGQASPSDSAPPSSAPAAASRQLNTRPGNLLLLKARVTDRQTAKLNEILSAFFARQGKSVLSAIGSGRADWWDQDRWNSELSSDLHATALSITSVLGKSEAHALGYTADDYHPEATLHYLQAVCDRYADNINTTTKSQLDDELGDPDGQPSLVFDQATSSRAEGISQGMGTFMAGFATTEAASQIARAHDVEPTKTWVTGPNPRPEHAALDGETVGMEEPFSNGLMWPGAAGGDAAEVAGCNCTVICQI
jgi:HK97 family phage portal protein